MAYLRGIDVSKWQETTPNLSGLSFLWARASIGTAKDVKYDMHVRNASDAGLLVGAYHFNWDTLSIGEQVRAFLRAAGDVDFYAIDVEGANAFSVDQTKRFIEGVQDAGKKIGLYHSDSGFFSAGQDYNWVAKWSTTKPSRSWKFWQYRGSPLDLDYFDGTLAELKALAGISTGVDMRPFMFRPVPSGYLQVRGTGRYYLDLMTNKLVGPLADGWPGVPKRAHPARLITPIPGSGDRSTGFVMPESPAFFLATDVEFKPDLTNDELLAQIASLKSDLAVAEDFLTKCKAFSATLKEQNKGLTVRITELEIEITVLRGRIRAAQEALNV